MKKDVWVLILSIIGVLFSGYLTFTKLVLGVCPIKESCPFLWGYPICVYGLIMFIIVFLASLIYYFKKDTFNKNVIIFVSFVGVLFSIYYTIYDFMICNGCTYSLLLPTCAYGLVVYVLILLFSIKLQGKI
jgi:hypothetical protein